MGRRRRAPPAAPLPRDRAPAGSRPGRSGRSRRAGWRCATATRGLRNHATRWRWVRCTCPRLARSISSVPRTAQRHAPVRRRCARRDIRGRSAPTIRLAVRLQAGSDAHDPTRQGVAPGPPVVQEPHHPAWRGRRHGRSTAPRVGPLHQPRGSRCTVGPSAADPTPQTRRSPPSSGGLRGVFGPGGTRTVLRRGRDRPDSGP
jgi:hypothetical protein